MSDQIGLLVKLLLPSVAISIAINYLGSLDLALVPTTGVVLTAVFLPAAALAVALWLRG